eukprot:9324750-Ditylum_brightwellii.AAC.1
MVDTRTNCVESFCQNDDYTKQQLDCLLIPHHDVEYLILWVETKSNGGRPCLHGLVRLNFFASIREVRAILGPFIFKRNSKDFTSLRIKEYKEHKDSIEVKKAK